MLNQVLMQLASSTVYAHYIGTIRFRVPCRHQVSGNIRNPSDPGELIAIWATIQMHPDNPFKNVYYVRIN